MADAALHRWKFFRAGGFDQVHLATGADLVALEELDQKLWFALACPTRGLEFDARTLELLDTQKDSRIRANELIEATRFVRRVFKNPDDLAAGGDSVPLAAIDEGTDDGKRVLLAAKTVLSGLGGVGSGRRGLPDDPFGAEGNMHRLDDAGGRFPVTT